jgi:hypothetical protein
LTAGPTVRRRRAGPCWRSWATYSSGFPSGITGHVSFRFLPTGNEVMVSWAFAIASGTTLNANTTIATVASKFS